ncbi:MAG: hypothetical protein Kow00107_09370 [Planctomycetota bacterium]
MREIAALLYIVRRQSARIFHDVVLATPKRTLIAATLWALVWSLLFILFHEGWQFLSRDEVFIVRDQITFTIWSLFFFPLMTMLGFSACVISFSSFFQSKETDLLLTLPITDVAVFFHKAREAVGFAGWATMFLALPLIVTYGYTYSDSIWFYPASLAVFIPFVLLSASFGVIIALLIGLIAPGSRKILLGLTAVLAGLGLWQLVEELLKAREAFQLASERLWLREVFDRVEILRSDFLPSGWMTHAVSSASKGEWGEFLFNFSVLTANALFFFSLSLIIGWFALRLARQRVSVSMRVRKYNANGTFSAVVRGLLFYLPPATVEMVLKDLKTFVRTPGQWTQFLIFFGLLGFYVLNLRTFNYHIQSEYWRNMISYTNLAATGLVLASFTGRFVFPLISLEGTRIWVLGLAPISRKQVLMAKFWFSFLGSTFVSAVLMIASDVLLELPVHTIALHMATMVLVCFGLSGLSVGLGAIYPTYNEENPARIISGFGGTVNMVFSLAYVLVTVMTVSVAFRFMRWFGAETQILVFTGVIAFVGVLAFAAGYLPLKVGIRQFEKAQF